MIGNNVANVNSPGFKKSRAVSAEAYVTTVRAGAGSLGDRGGLNPAQIGLGTGTAAIDQIMTQGSIERTGIRTDLAIEGDGMFMLNDGDATYYTRAGNFILDASGRLVHGTSGLPVQGLLADANGEIPETGQVQDMVLPPDLSLPGSATSELIITGNLDSRMEPGDVASFQSVVYDSLGREHPIDFVFTNNGPNSWDWEATDVDGNVVGNGTATFNPDGSVDAFTGGVALNPPGADPIVADLLADGADTYGGLTQYGSSSSAYAVVGDGNSFGTLEEISFDRFGTMIATFSNGENRELGRIGLARFPNAEGLLSGGDGLFTEGPNSGGRILEFPGLSGASLIVPEALEASNVDIGEEFVEMIVTQRGFQANARMITTADEITQELVNLRR